MPKALKTLDLLKPLYGTYNLIGYNQKKVKQSKNKMEGKHMIVILCIIVFPFVVLGYLMKMNK